MANAGAKPDTGDTGGTPPAAAEKPQLVCPNCGAAFEQVQPAGEGGEAGGEDKSWKRTCATWPPALPKPKGNHNNAMAITLTSQTVPTSPVTPRSAAQVIFDNNYAKLAALPLKQRLVVALLGMIHAMSGTVDYRNAHRQMIQDATVFLAGIETPIDLWAVLAAFSWTMGKTLDPANLSSTIDGMLAEALHFNEQSEEELIREFLFVSLL